MQPKILSLALCLAIAAPAFAETAPAAKAPEPSANPAPAMKLMFQLGEDAPSELDLPAFSSDPMAKIVELVQQTYHRAKANKGPAKSQITLETSGADSILKDFPPAELTTRALGGNKGETTLTMKALTQDITDGERAGSIDWKGLTGKLNYPGTFQEISGNLDMPGWTLKIDQEADMALDQLKLTGTLDADFTPLKLDGGVKAFRMTVPNTGIANLADLAFNLDLTPVPSGLKLGKATAHLAQLILDRGDEGKLTVNKLALASESQAKDGNVAFTFNTTLEKAELPAALASPSLREVDFALDFGVHNLDETFLAEVENTITTMQKQGASDGMMMMSLMGKLTQAAPRLLQRSPRVEMSKLRMKTSGGEVTGHLKLDLDGSKYQGDGKQPVLYTDPALLKSALVGEADFFVPGVLLREFYHKKIAQDMAKAAMQQPADAPDAKPSAELTPEQIGQMVDSELKALQVQHLIVPEGDGYRTKVSFQDGKLTINGKEQPLPF